MVRKLLRKTLYQLNGRAILLNGRKLKLPEKFISHFNVRQNNPMEPELYAILGQLLKPGDVFVDVGANVGVISLLASERVGPKGSVIVIEPNPATFGYLSEIIAANKVHENFIMLQLAVSDKVELLPLQINSNDSVLMERASIVHHEAGTNTFNVFTNTLDNLVPKGYSPTVLKIDVEGAELSVLEGSKNLISRSKPMVSLEVHGLYFDDMPKHVNTVFAFFEKLGYTAVNIFTAKVETAANFIVDSGTDGLDPQSGRPLRNLGYGNLIFVADEVQKNQVLEACKKITH